MEQFIKECDAFIERHKISATAFGRDYAKDRSFLFEVRAGRDCGLRKADEIRALMKEADASPQDTAA